MLESLWYPILGGLLAGAVALAVGGLPALLSLAFRVQRLEVELVRETKRRASESGVAARGQRVSEAELLATVAGQQEPRGPRLIGSGR